MPRFKASLAILALLTLAVLTVGSPPAAIAVHGQGVAGSPAYVPGEILIKFKPAARALDKASARAQVNGLFLRAFRSGAEHWKLGPGVGVEQAVERMKRNRLVQYAEPNYLFFLDVIPNDPNFGGLWGLYNTGQTGGTADADIDAEMAWNVSTGGHDVVVGVIDTGCDYNHADLAPNIWVNPGEIAGNGMDDDGNGFVDDVHGYDFINGDSDPWDDHYHGTHVSGTIGAVGNNGVGVVGVNWHVSIMCLKIFNAAGSTTSSAIIQAVDYSVMMTVDLTSNSWGGGAFSQALYDAIAAAGAANQAFVAAAGNDYRDTDVTPHYPSSYDLANIIAVAATDHNDEKAAFSNWGLTSVDLGAPGVDVLSTMPGNSYGLLSGTSMATPHVSGVAALLRAVNPGIPVAQMKNLIMSRSDPKPSMQGRTVSGGRLNAFFPIAQPDTTPPGAVADLATNNPGSNFLSLTWTAPGDDGNTGTAAYYEVRRSTSPIDETNWAAATRAGNEPAPLPAGTPQSMEVGGLAHSTLYYFAVKAFDEWGNPGSLSNVATGTTLGPPTVDLAPTTINDSLLTGQQSDWTVMLRNAGAGTLDFAIPTPALGAVTAIEPPLVLGKDDPDPRVGDPVVAGSGGPDAFGYRWTDSDEPGGPAFDWIDISTTGTPVTVTGDDAISPPIALSFNMPFYGALFGSFRVCTNGFLSFTDSATTYTNQPLPNSGGPANLVAPFWDDLNPGATQQIYFQDFGTMAIVQWHQVPRYNEAGSSLTFQAILDSSGAVTYQYLSLAGTLNSATVGIQNATKRDGLTVAFNTAYLHDNLAVRLAAMPQWLTVAPTSGRLHAGQSVGLNVHLDASGLEGGTYPGEIHVLNNDPDRPDALVNVHLHVQGAPDAAVQPASLDFGDAFLGLPETLTLVVLNNGTDTLHVSDVAASHPDLSASPAAFNVPPHGSQNVTVSWTPSLLGPFAGSVTVHSDDAGEPSIVVPVAGNAIPAPVLIPSPGSFSETLYSGNYVDRTLRITNAGGSPLILTAAADLGPGGTGLVYSEGPFAEGSGGPDAFGYRWRDSDASGGPLYNWIDISTTGTQIFGGGVDDSLSSTINMGMTFPFYGNGFTSLKVSSNGWLTFTTTESSFRATNYNLPSTSGAPNMIAMFWDDLHTRTNGRVHYEYDGTRFIVQYTNVDKYSPSGSLLTFQVQLYPSGKILLMYNTMTGTLNSATIGVQNQARTIGLPVNYNANYVHNNLALQISRTPDWLSVTPAGATIPPGGFSDFSVRFDATDRPGGILNGSVVLNTNIPSQPQYLVPATLRVIGAPQIGLVPASYNFGTVFVGYPQATSFFIVNNGTDVLNVADVTTTDPALVVEEPPGGSQAPAAAFAIPPGGSHVLDMRWLPAATGPLGAYVEVRSDDPVTPLARLAATGNAILPPEAVWTPTSYGTSLMVGDVENWTLHLENHGGSDLTFSTAVRLLTGAPVTVYDELDLKKDEPDPRPGILGSGGPDMYGYRWRDSDHPAGPTFDWQDIGAVGTPIPITGDDSISGVIPLGMSFPYYGASYTSAKVCTNGWISFDPNNTACPYTNQPFPYSSGVRAMVAAFWDDLDFRGAQKAKYHADGSKFIVQFTDVDRHSTSDLPYPAHLTFQIILYPNGRIVTQYQTMYGFLTSATIGIQNWDRNDGLTVAYNAAYMHDGLAVAFYPPVDFLSVSPTSGTIPAGGAADLDVRIDTTYLIGGDYAASLDLLTNDPARGLIAVPCYLDVTGMPDIEAVPTSLTFPTTFVGFGASLPLTIRNMGTDVLHVSGAYVTGDFAMTGLTTPVDLPPAGAVPVTVTFAPAAEGTRAGAVTVASDDPDENPLVIPLVGEGLHPPIVGVSPASISTALPPGGMRTKTETICNTGGSDLIWTSGAQLISALVVPGSYLELGKGEEDPRPGLLGSGGPDLFGYSWTDSDEPGGPAFGWVDISGVGTPISFDPNGYCDDCNAGPFPIGFPFSFYGNPFSSVRVTTNGWLSFTSTLTTYTNQPLPNAGSSVPENLAAAFWDDLVLRNGSTEPRASRAYYHSDGTRFIVQWSHFYRIANYTDDLNFEVILYPSGRIVYQYLMMSTSTLNSATVGIQNAMRDDGLTVVYNANYVHDGLAVEFKAIPEWMTLAPASGTVPAGGCQDVVVTLNAAGLDDGVHEGTIQVVSNDPYTPLVTVPVGLNVGIIEPTMVEFDPDVLNLSSDGNTVKTLVELPSGYDPHAAGIGSILLNDAVPVVPPPPPVAFSDVDRDGYEELVLKFDRSAVESILPEGTSVMVCVQGEITDVQWWRGCTTIRAIRPQVMGPSAGQYFLIGDVVPIRWTAPAWNSPMSYAVQLTRDGGASWEEIASGLTGTSYDWIASGAETADARVRVLAFDPQGLLGYDTGDGAFTIAGRALRPPNPVDGTGLGVAFDGSNLTLAWKAPAADLAHGPADRYRVLRGGDPSLAGMTEAAVVTGLTYTEAVSPAPAGTVVFYRIVAANAAGDAP